MRNAAWETLLHWSKRVDDRDMSDEAREWAESESKATSLPENTGSWKASMEIAFEAGRQYERLLRGR